MESRHHRHRPISQDSDQDRMEGHRSSVPEDANISTPETRDICVFLVAHITPKSRSSSPENGWLTHFTKLSTALGKMVANVATLN